jgi:tetrahydromethanopterin S-methyltransferase subunit G
MPFKSKAQQRFMYATMPKTAEKWSHETPNIKKLPQHVKEEGMEMMQGPQMQSWDHPGCEDKVGKIFIVLKPNPESSPEDLVHQTHAFGTGQFDPQSVHGVYGDGEEANIVAEAAINDLHKHLHKVEKKKDHVMGEIDKHIARLQKEINNHMKEATEKPELSEAHHQQAERKMHMIKGLRDKHKAIKATKREIPENPTK